MESLEGRYQWRSRGSFRTHMDPSPRRDSLRLTSAGTRFPSAQGSKRCDANSWNDGEVTKHGQPAHHVAGSWWSYTNATMCQANQSSFLKFIQGIWLPNCCWSVISFNIPIFHAWNPTFLHRSSPDMALGVDPPLTRAPIGTKLAQSEASSPCFGHDDDLEYCYSIVALSKEVGKQSSELRMTFTQWDFTLHSNTFIKGGGRLYITWRVVWACTSQNNTFMKGGVKLYIT